MKKELLNIVKNHRHVFEDIVDVDLLCRHTTEISEENRSQLEWKRIKHLHFLGVQGRQDLQSLRQRLINQTGIYVDATKTWVLVVGATAFWIRKYLSLCSADLEMLSVQYSSMEKIDISNLTGLRKLILANNSQLCRVSGLTELLNIKDLDISFTDLGPEIDLNYFEYLEEVNLTMTPTEIVRLEQPLVNLRCFYGGHTQIQDTSFLTYCPALTHLYLHETPICSMGESCLPENLVTLTLAGTSIRKIPNSIRHLNQLKRLDLSNMNLDELPEWLPELNMKFDVEHDNQCINLWHTKIRDVDMSVFSQPQEVILQWFEERKKANAGAPLNEVKVVFLGDGEAGKTHTIARLLNDGGDPVDFTGDSTPGIVITDKSYDIGDRSVRVHFWDFGGQEILHSMHRMFLTERTLYVILINARDDTQDDRARYWLHNVKSFANGAPVLLVLNKMDQNPNASVNESDLRTLYPGLTEVVKLSALNDDPGKFNASFTEAMKRQIGSMENLSFFFPAAWTKAKQRLLGMTENYIYGSDYAAICDECGVSGEGDLRRGLLNWFNDLGVSICYGGSRRLRDYVILRPNWITNAIYAILFNKHPETRNGIISHDAIFEMIQPPKEGDDPYRRTNSTESYTDVEIDYILNVTRKFRLSFRVDDDHEFIPMLCDRESKPIAAEYAADPDALEFHMTFDYLPGNVLHRLMVELRQDLDTSRVWRTGAHFEQKSSGLSAVVKSEGNVLKLFVRGSGKSHKSNTYLCILKDTLDRIVKDMNLEPPVNEVVYKLEGKRQAFDYDELVESQEQGETARYSRVHKRRLFIDDILNQTCRSAETEREQLLRDILAACAQMQANKRNWKSEDDRVKEDDRNTYIRDLLRAKGYHASDQTFSGSSATGKQAGEVDLMILRESDIPWTLIEALNISGKQFQNWEKHLTKLLDHYNANGLPFLFLVSYVDVSKDAYGGVISAYSEHLRFYSPDQYILQSEAPVESGIDPGHHIQTAKCVYDRGGFPTTVYHIFVRMGA